MFVSSFNSWLFIPACAIQTHEVYNSLVLVADPISPESKEQQIDSDSPNDIDDQNGGGDDDGDGDNNDPSNWITIATFWQPTEAHIARLKLESEEIDCLLIDENLVATDWLYANAVGGIKLRVPQSEATRARLLLARPTTSNPIVRSEAPIFQRISILFAIAALTGLLIALLIT